MASDPLIGTSLGPYLIKELIGRGGMSRVFRAEHKVLGTSAAVKVLTEELSQDPEFRERFLFEARLAARISQEHPHILEILHADEQDGLLYMAMDLVEEGDLRGLLERESPLDPRRSLDILRQVADALDYAHSLELVHRDIKPANVLIDRGDRALVADFGIAKDTRAATGGLTRVGTFVGTIDYAAPEQIQGAEIDGRADQYALACILYQCLAGVVPFPRDSDVQAMYAHLNEPPPPVTAAQPDLPPAVDEVLRRGLAKQPADRFESCLALVDAAATTLSAPVPAPPPPREPALTSTPAPVPPAPPADEPPPPPPPPPEEPAAAGMTRASSSPAVTPPPPPPPPSPPPAPPSPGAPRRRSRRPLVLGALAVALVGGGIGLAVALSGGEKKAATTSSPFTTLPTTIEPPTTTLPPTTTEPPPTTTVTTTETEPGLDRFQQELLQYVPTAIRAACIPVDLEGDLGHGSAQLQCEDTGRGVTAQYALYGDPEEMTDAYARARGEYEVPELSGSTCATESSENIWQISGEPFGRIFCTDAGRLQWYDERFSVGAFAFTDVRSAASVAQIYAWWACCSGVVR